MPQSQTSISGAHRKGKEVKETRSGALVTQTMASQLASSYHVIDRSVASQLLQETEPEAAEKLLTESCSKLVKFDESPRLYHWLMAYYFGVLTEVARARCTMLPPPLPCEDLPSSVAQTATDSQLTLLLSLSAYAFHVNVIQHEQDNEEETPKYAVLDPPMKLLERFSSANSPPKLLLDAPLAQRMREFLQEIFECRPIMLLLKARARACRHLSLPLTIYTPHVQRQYPPPPIVNKTPSSGKHQKQRINTKPAVIGGDVTTTPDQSAADDANSGFHQLNDSFSQQELQKIFSQDKPDETPEKELELPENN